MILNVKDGYRKLILTYSVSAALVYAGFVFAYHHYAVGLLSSYLNDAEMGEAMALTFFYSFTKNGYMSLNIFIDLALCALFMYFINYTPTKYFKGKKIRIFRLFALLPILYEFLSIFLKTESVLGNVVLPVEVYPLLTTKPPITFLVFILLAALIKNREKFFIRHDKTHADFKSYLETNYNSLRFSLITSIIVLGAVILDLLLCIIITASIIPAGETLNYESVVYYLSSAYNLGFGKSVILIFTIPFILLFSYTRTYKNV